MLSIKKCSKILNKNGRNYTQKQVIDIREFMYQITEIILESKITNDE